MTTIYELSKISAFRVALLIQNPSMKFPKYIHEISRGGEFEILRENHDLTDSLIKYLSSELLCIKKANSNHTDTTFWPQIVTLKPEELQKLAPLIKIRDENFGDFHLYRKLLGNESLLLSRTEFREDIYELKTLHIA